MDSMRPCQNNRCVVLTTYENGARSGKNLGAPGYSYEFVTQLFEPLFRDWGKFVAVEDPAVNLEPTVASLQQQGYQPVHVCLRGLHDVVPSRTVPNIVIPAWEFPDVPDHGFDDNPRNNWVQVANESSLVIVGGEFTRRAFANSGVTTPIRIVPVPTPDSYFSVPTWDPQSSVDLDCDALVLGPTETNESLTISRPEASQEATSIDPAGRLNRRPISEFCRTAYRTICRRVLPTWLDYGLTIGIRAALLAKRQPETYAENVSHVHLKGVVYTSIFNPSDGRKNWEDLLSGFLIGLKDCDDATLVLKLVSADRRMLNQMLARYSALDIAHRCKIVIITKFLSDEQMADLANATTYYVTTTHAEGNCLPVMNYLAAARPAITPSHTAIADYFSEEIGFPVDCSDEPAAWPQDPLFRCRTTWSRLNWASFVDALQNSHQLVRDDLPSYVSLGNEASRQLRALAHPDSVRPRLHAALDECLASSQIDSTRAIQKVA